MLLGFLDRGGIGQWAYAIACDIAAEDSSFIRFTMEDVDFKTRTINGESWINGSWEKILTPFPMAIRNFERYNEKDKILDIVPYSLGYIIKKEDQLEYLLRNPNTSKYIPKTLHVNEKTPIIDKIKSWKYALLKPSFGRLGQGIIFIKYENNNFTINEDGQSSTLSINEFKEYLKPFITQETRSYMLQQFAAGTNKDGRYFNVRVIVTKSSDGNWHVSPKMMSLLAKENSIIANRDVGSKNIDLDSLIKHKFNQNKEKIYHELFKAAILISEELDDLSKKGAEELALDMAIDDDGGIWLHEANWRGGIWLFEDEVGIYRHGGKNLKRIGIQSRAGNNLDRANGLNIIKNNRKDIYEYLKQESNCNFENSVVFGIDISRQTDDIISSLSLALSLMIPTISVSNSSSLRISQKNVKYAIEGMNEQTINVPKPLIISKGGAIVYDISSNLDYKKWIEEELIKKTYINEAETLCGFSLSRRFLKETIKNNCKDLNLKTLDLFIIEGIEYSLENINNWENKWLDVIIEMTQCKKEKLINEWGFSINIDKLFSNDYTSPEKLLNLITNNNHTKPTFIEIILNNNTEEKRIKEITKKLKKIPLKVMYLVKPLDKSKKTWNKKYEIAPLNFIKTLEKYVPSGQIILLSVETISDINSIVKEISGIEEIDIKKFGNPWIYKKEKTKPYYLESYKMKNKVEVDKLKLKKRMDAISLMANFDHRQFFRFFVDGRFHKKYNGWIGYEANEEGSVGALMNAYAYMMDNFDLSNGLKSTYIRNLHAIIMKNVKTSNPKSTPGDMRFLEAGLHIYSHYSTKNSIKELLELRQNDETTIFHTKGYEKKAEEFSVDEIYDSLQIEKKLRFRNWYPNLSQEQIDSLNNPENLSIYYDVKHQIQKEFAKKLDTLVETYNEEIKNAKNENDILIAISRIVRNGEILHPFPDGNGRVLVALLMNHLLMYNGFTFAILFDPNIDIELSVEEFANEIRSGLENTKLLLENPEHRLYDFSILDLPQEEIKNFENLSKELIFKLSAYKNQEFELSQSLYDNLKATYIYLTPQRIESITKGKWLNIQNKDLDKLRFESIQIDEINSPNQLFCLRNKKNYENNESILKYIDKISNNGVTAIMIDDIQIAKDSSLPALYVEDVDDALAIMARVSRREINPKVVAVVGRRRKKFTKNILHSLLKSQIEINVLNGEDNKTPHIMTSLSNLKLTHSLEINEISIDNRANPVSFRSRRIEPNICFLTELDIEETQDEEKILEAYSAMVDGFGNDGLYIINSEIKSIDKLINVIRARKNIAIQTFGNKNDDLAEVLSIDIDDKKIKSIVKIKLFDKELKLTINTTDLKIINVITGLLLVIENLGYDINLVIKDLKKINFEEF